MGGRYGMSYAAKHIRDGQYEEAIAAATKELTRNDDNPEPLLERAEALFLLGRYLESAADLERAVELDKEAGLLEIDAVDDSYFNALLAAARAEAPTDLDTAATRLARYPTIFPTGRHLTDATDWLKRLRGELKSQFVKERY